MSFHDPKATVTAPYPKTSPRHAEGGSRASTKFSAPDSDRDRAIPEMVHTTASPSDTGNLRPCGTYAAYRRHIRRGEPVDGACAQASRDQYAERADMARAESARVVRLAIANEPPVEFESELAETLENLEIVRTVMEDAPPTAIASLSRRREDLVRRAVKLSAAPLPGSTVLDQLAQRRAERLRTARSS